MTDVRPTIVHTHLHHRRSGASTHVEAIVPALRALGADAWAYGMTLVDEVPKLTFKELWRRLRAGPAVMHVHRNNELLFALLLRPFAKALKIFVTRHTGLPPGGFTKWLIARADHLITLTRDQANHFPPGADVIGHGVDVQRFTPPPDKTAAFKALGLPGERGIGVVGRIRKPKGQGDFAEAIAPLLPDHPEWHVALVGWTAPKDEPFAAALKEKLRDRVTFTGERPDILRWYQGLTILVHPSHTEGYSLVLLEAMAAGCCVVATALPYTEGLVEHGRNGFLFPPGDVAALRKILTELLAAPARAEAIGRAAAEDARARLGVDAQAKKHLALYEAALTTSRKTA